MQAADAYINSCISDQNSQVSKVPWWFKRLLLTYNEELIKKIFPSQGMFGALDYNVVQVVARSDFALLKPRKRADGRTTSSRLYPEVGVVDPRLLPQCTPAQKQAILQGSAKSVDLTTVTKTSRGYARCSKRCRDSLPLSWVSIEPEWHAKFISDHGANCIVDFSTSEGRWSMASLSCADVVTCLGLVHNSAHKQFVSKNLVHHVLKLMATEDSTRFFKRAEVDQLKEAFPSLFGDIALTDGGESDTAMSVGEDDE